MKELQHKWMTRLTTGWTSQSGMSGTTGKTILCQKDSGKGNAVDNYQPILCPPIMWKLMTGIEA